ncbi:RING finger protein [Paragonimus heterotremus]|uniref:RING finger protein n=1 Tax=Paragonimus heterotremus TaxID=100268 RepID=A0A8J4T6J1_9TREM|nr:RING finger protein [Paragonimus heterotremus]
MDPDVIVLNNVTYHLSKLPPEEQMRIKHLKLHEIHRGHEEMHLEMFIIAMVSLFVCQVLLMTWKKYHFKTYQFATLIAMWTVPFVYSLFARFPRFIVIWFLFSLITGSMVYMASKKRISTTTPRRVYRWFLFMHNASYALGVGGYVLMMLTIFQLNHVILLPTNWALDIALLTLFYGIYYGVISRDFAEVCTDKMAAQIGYCVPQGMPVRRFDPTTCSICTNQLKTDACEPIHRLNCAHAYPFRGDNFHDFCIRGWCIVGKKDICPYCKEKVDLRKTFTNPYPFPSLSASSIWDKPHLLYGNFLDLIRYLVAWQPVILGLVHVVNTSLGLK